MTHNPSDSMPFSKLMGVKVTQAGKESVRGELLVRADLCTTGNILHGGAIMAFADALGAVGGFLNLPEGAAGTTTIESKTNFMRAAPEGMTVQAEARPLKLGSKVSVWSTEIKRPDGKLVAVVTQTQLIL